MSWSSSSSRGRLRDGSGAAASTTEAGGRGRCSEESFMADIADDRPREGGGARGGDGGLEIVAAAVGAENLKTQRGECVTSSGARGMRFGGHGGVAWSFPGARRGSEDSGGGR